MHITENKWRAVRYGIHGEMIDFGIEESDLDLFYLAGGFAQHLDLNAARRIGLIPELPDRKIIQLGNASVQGATRVLISRSAREELEQLVRQVKHIELETFPDFFQYFAEGVQFAPFDRSSLEGIRLL